MIKNKRLDLTKTIVKHLTLADLKKQIDEEVEQEVLTAAEVYRQEKRKAAGLVLENS